MGQIKADVAWRAAFDYDSEDERREEWKPAVVNPTKSCRLCSKSFAGWGDICQVCRRIPGGIQQACKECGGFFQGFRPICHDCERSHRTSTNQADQDFSITGAWMKQAQAKPPETKP